MVLEKTLAELGRQTEKVTEGGAGVGADLPAWAVDSEKVFTLLTLTAPRGYTQHFQCSYCVLYIVLKALNV